jgi:hypothetical protein
MKHDLNFTEHANLKKNQRCKRDDRIGLIVAYFDRDVYVRKGVWAWSVSRRWCEHLRRDGLISRAMAEQLPRLALLIAEDTHAVVSVICDTGPKFGRYVSNSH